MQVLALILFTPVALAAGAILLMILIRLRLLPAGIHKPIAYLLLITFSFGSLLLWNALDELVLMPRQVQRELVGRQLGSPLDLRRYEAFGFQDPHYEWHYAVGPELLRQLRTRCRHRASMAPSSCLLAERQEGRTWSGIGLDGDALRVEVTSW